MPLVDNSVSRLPCPGYLARIVAVLAVPCWPGSFFVAFESLVTLQCVFVTFTLGKPDKAIFFYGGFAWYDVVD